MDNSTTLALKAAALVALIVLAVLAAYVLGTRGHDRPGERAITLAGEGRVNVVPDRATVTLGVQVTRPEANAAMDEASATQQKVIAALGKAGVDKDDIRTTGLDLQPAYDYSGRGEPRIIGYSVTQSVKVTLRDLAGAGAVLARAAEAGGNAIRIDSFKLSAGDKDDALGDAREKAIKDARKKADQYAAAAGREVGKVVRIEEVDSQEGPTPRFAADGDSVMAAAHALEKAPIEPGQQKVTVRVRVVFELR